MLASRRLQVPPAYLVPPLDGLGGLRAVPGRGEQRRAALYDTDSLDLTRWGARIEHDPSSGWRIELPGVGALPRAVHRLAGGPVVPSAVVDALSSLTAGQPLRRLVRLDVRAEVVLLIGGDEEPTVVVADEEISVTEGRRLVARFRELVLRPGSGATDATLDEVERALVMAGASVLEGGTSRLIEVFGQRAVTPPLELPDPESRDREPRDREAVPDRLAAFVTERLRAHVRGLLIVVPHLRVGGGVDALELCEAGLRGLRAELQLWREHLEEDVGDLVDELTALHEQVRWILEPQRLMTSVATAAATLGAEDDRGFLDEALRDEYRCRHEALREVLAPGSVVRTWSAVAALGAGVEVQGASRGDDPAELARQIAVTWWEALERQVAAGEASEQRATLEVLRAASVLGKQAGHKGAKRFRTRLDRYHDALLMVGSSSETTAWLTRCGREQVEPERALLVGRLCGALEVRCAEARRELTGAWEDCSSPKGRRWLDG